ncbi:MAG: hypothetical protein M1419_00965 [Bacteroidetes bacterium]|nr:hypothetical protein [Bacteroidota bacterium]
MVLFVKYIAAIISSFSLLFSTTGVSLLHHICIQMGHHNVSLFYGNVNEDECGSHNSGCSTMCEVPSSNQPSYSVLDCCKDFTDYTVISISFISQQIEKLSTNILFNESNFLNEIQKHIDESFNKILLKPPGILKLPVLNIISFIIHSTDISSELPA